MKRRNFLKGAAAAAVIGPATGSAVAKIVNPIANDELGKRPTDEVDFGNDHWHIDQVDSREEAIWPKFMYVEKQSGQNRSGWGPMYTIYLLTFYNGNMYRQSDRVPEKLFASDKQMEGYRRNAYERLKISIYPEKYMTARG